MVVEYITDAIRDAAKEKKGWFYASELVAAVSERVGKPVTSRTIGKYMVPLCENEEIARKKKDEKMFSVYLYRYGGKRVWQRTRGLNGTTKT